MENQRKRSKNKYGVVLKSVPSNGVGGFGGKPSFFQLKGCGVLFAHFPCERGDATRSRWAKCGTVRLFNFPPPSPDERTPARSHILGHMVWTVREGPKLRCLWNRFAAAGVLSLLCSLYFNSSQRICLAGHCRKRRWKIENQSLTEIKWKYEQKKQRNKF